VPRRLSSSRAWARFNAENATLPGTRGGLARGGYALARRAGDIALLEVIEAVSGPVRLEVRLPSGGPEAEGLRRPLEAVCGKAAAKEQPGRGRRVL
jgi:hypothetical protein